MLSDIPIDVDKVNKKELDKEILRAGIIAELDAINLYEQMAAKATDKNLKKIIGKKLKKQIKEPTPLTWEMID